ncbi:FAD-binding protein [Rubrobacter aplysinae]|uniref:FAD-binding protein n=1 Tax=Rubrobacter aplysinae TaxID=909625 RepID=UPI00064C2A32|nr:FAD-binding protein [Rubrobacter aplysinae]
MPDYDMVVIGSGFAGSTATLSFLETTEKAGQAGRVALIEAGKRGVWPGASRWARPFLRLNRDNKLLRDRVVGVEHDRRSMSDLDYWRKLEDEVPSTVKFMEDHGVKLDHHDEENAAMDFEEQHFVFLRSGGKEIIDFYLEHIAKYETVDVLWEHEAIELTVDDEGRVGGIVVRKPDGQQRTITAHTVILACGGFGGNPEMLREHTGQDTEDLPTIAPGIRYNRGAGIRMAMDAGAGTAGQFDMFHAELVDTRARAYHAVIWGLNYGIVVNENCERFHDEGEDYLFATSELIAYDTWRHQNQKSYFITDKTVMDRFEGSWVYERTDKPPEQSDTISGLAEKLGLDPAKLEATVSEFNAACGPGDWNPVKMDGKKTSGITPPKSNWANPIVEAPFFGFPMTAHFMFNFGGLKADMDGRALNANEEPIPGLYAAGEITGLFHHKQPPATSVLRANTFGRIIGANIARSLPETAAAHR